MAAALLQVQGGSQVLDTFAVLRRYGISPLRWAVKSS
jgi:hypothetical protein